jgi:hypothetical protein
MKKALIYTFLILALAFASANTVMAQPHPNQQSGDGSVSGQRLGEGAPVGNGTFILLTLAMAYAGRKWYTGNKTITEE